MSLANKIKIIGGAVTGIAVIFVGLFWLADFVRLPDRVEANEEDVQDIKDYVREQRVANDLQRDWQQQYKYERPQYEQPPRRCYDYANDGYQYEIDCITGDWM